VQAMLPAGFPFHQFNSLQGDTTVLVVLKLFMSGNERCHTTGAPSARAELYFQMYNIQYKITEIHKYNSTYLNNKRNLNAHLIPYHLLHTPGNPFKLLDIFHNKAQNIYLNTRS